jgi:NAD-dependent dihydropyrimidine dehydrogenase PreA subunit
MFIQINQELCAGCNTCVEACSVGAIQLVNQRAAIDDALCTQCEACIDACPNGAITAISVPAHNTSITALHATESQIVPVQDREALPEKTSPARLAPLAGPVLAFLGREVAPRLADMLLTVLERRLAQPATTGIASVSPPSRNQVGQGRGERRQLRYRGGRVDKKDNRERR